MNKRSLGALIALNVSLVLALACVLLTPETAHSQGLGGSTFLMISGDTSGVRSQSVIYIIDSTNGRVFATSYNGNSDKWENYTAAPRDMVGDFRR